MAKVSYRHGKAGKPRAKARSVKPPKTKGTKLKEVLGSLVQMSGRPKKTKFRWRDDPAKAGALSQSKKIRDQEKLLEEGLSKKKKQVTKDAKDQDSDVPLATFEEYSRNLEAEKQKRTQLRKSMETPEAEAERLGRTLFVRNLPHDTARQALYEFFAERGGVARVNLVMSKEKLFRGSAFVEMKLVEDANKILDIERQAKELLSGRAYGLQAKPGAASVSFTGMGLIFNGRKIFVSRAVNREKAAEMRERKQEVRDKRNLHLAAVAHLDEAALEALPKADKSRRLETMRQMRERMMSPNTFFNPRRIVLRNIPTRLSNNELKAFIVDFLVDNCEAELQQLRHVIMSGGKRKARDSVDACLTKRPIGTKLLALKAVKAQVVMKKTLVLKNDTTARTQRYAFAEFADHSLARKVLLHFNNNANAFGTGQRAIVEFALEDHRALLRAKDRKNKLQKGREAKEKTSIRVK